ncbi:MAG: sterol desaturase family protein [Bacteroidota bacterium]
MEAYAAALTYAIPFFVLLILIEVIAAWRMGRKINRGMDTISSLSSGMTNTIKDILGLSIVILSYEWMVNHWAIFEIEANWWVFLVTFILMDLAAYWSHRFNHTINLFWNRHIVHHSSEEFNLSCALRQSISEVFGIYFFLYIPIALLGVPALVIAIVSPIHLFAQFWYHTRLINKMGWLEYIIVTPSHHRVHHAINPEYIDKNYAAIFIVWDKWFGTFQEELEDQPPVYGTLKPVSTWNPVWINFMHFWGILKDAWRTEKWWDKLRIWFMPTGWRPSDVKEKYPVKIVADVYKREKYDTQNSQFLLLWSWFQLVMSILLIYYALYALAHLEIFSYWSILLYLSFTFISIFSYTALMDEHWMAIPLEVFKFIMGITFIYQFSGWFMIDELISGGSILMLIYLFTSMLLTLYFSFIEQGHWTTAKQRLTV